MHKHEFMLTRDEYFECTNPSCQYKFSMDEVKNILSDITNDELELADYIDKCEIQGCTQYAAYEGWYKVLDFSGNPTGLIQRRCVCDAHVNMLISKPKS